MPHMQADGEIPSKLKALRDRAGLTTQAVADELGRIRARKVPKSTYTYYESRDYKQPHIPVSLARELAVIFSSRGIEPTDVMALAGLSGIDPALKIGGYFQQEASGVRKPLDIVRAPPSNMPRDLPIRGYVKAGAEGVFIDQGTQQGVAYRPESLLGNQAAYAVRVHDTSMVPALEAGHLLHVDPYRPAQPGHMVVVQLAEGQAFIKKLVRRTERAVLCEQFNPREEVKYDPAKVISIHRVVGVSYIE